MGPSSELKALELDLTGADIKVGVEKLDRYDIVRKLMDHGVPFSGPKTAYESGKFQSYISGRLTSGKNYVILDGSPTVESQSEGEPSILFSYYHSDKRKSDVYLQMEKDGVVKARQYDHVKKIGFEKLDQLVKSSGLRYSEPSNRFFDIVGIENFGGSPSKAPSGRSAAEYVPKKPAPGPSKPDLFEAGKNGWRQMFSDDYELPFAVRSKMVSPTMEFMKLEKFDLKLLETYFRFPKHQRMPSKKHIVDMAEAMMERKFYANHVQVRGDVKNLPFDVEDGQHTLYSLRLLRDKAGLGTYNLYLLRRLDGKPVDIFVGLNKGKHLSRYDKENVVDDGSIPFYAELSPWLSHWKNTRTMKPRFVDICRAHLYATEGKTHVSDAEAIAIIPTLGPSVARKSKTFVKTFSELVGEDGSYMKRRGVIDNLYKAYIDMKMSEQTLAGTIERMKEDDGVFKLSRSTNDDDYAKLYDIVVKDAKKVRR